MEFGKEQAGQRAKLSEEEDPSMRPATLNRSKLVSRLYCKPEVRQTNRITVHSPIPPRQTPACRH
jgi:hypothetical protein